MGNFSFGGHLDRIGGTFSRLGGESWEKLFFPPTFTLMVT